MDWLKGLAPTLFEALTGNLPGAAISAATFIAAKFGWGGATPEYVKQRLTTLTPEEQLKFGALEFQFAQVETRRLHAQLLDDANARDREVQMASVGKRDLTTPIMAYVILSGFFLLLAFLIMFSVPAANASVIWFLAGQISAFAGAVVTYYYGSSSSSSEKNETISRMAAKQ